VARTKIAPDKIRLEASTVCQLRCPSCPTTTGEIARHLKSGFLKFDQFRKFIDENPRIRSIELSNWGESLLNPQFLQMLEYAHARRVELRLGNGANLNMVKPEVLEGVVKYQLRAITCSIDGASAATYPLYRVRGDFDRVIGNIERINEFKRKYDSPYPRLTWQFVAFGHNEHEIERARAMAARLDMRFALKLDWENLYDTPSFSPIRERDLIAKETGLGVATRAEYQEKFGQPYIAKTLCVQMWTGPQINFDGRVLGCCVNYWDDFGNAFTDGLSKVLNSERMQYARRMLMGKAPARDDIACTTCKFYLAMNETSTWITDKDLAVLPRRIDSIISRMRRRARSALRRFASAGRGAKASAVSHHRAD